MIKNNETGQTLIETMAAAFILAMGITAALSLALYSFRATTSVKQQIVALGLAREGIEVVKNMRDTNWLHGTGANDCHDFYSGGEDAFCYPDWLTAQYNIDEGSYYLNYRGGTYPWELVASRENFGLNFRQKDTGDQLFYTPSDKPVTQSTSGFGRRITIEKESGFDPFRDPRIGPRLKVTSEVWWGDKNCVLVNTPEEGGGCKVRLVTYLTNWKNFQ